jgi:hypothetical protein
LEVTPLEKQHESRFAKWLTDNGHDSERLQLKGQRGFPDRIVWLSDGTTCYVELKRPGGRLSIHQQRWKDRLGKTGQRWDVCYTAEEAIEFVEGLL